MLNNLPLDLILIIFLIFNNIKDSINIIKINKFLNKNINDSYFAAWGINHYGNNFWIKANSRSVSLSNPLNSMKFELLRLQNFIDTLKIQNIFWSNQDFYTYWNMLEEYKNKKNSKYIKNYFYTI